jgi:hypothetical protein
MQAALRKDDTATAEREEDSPRDDKRAAPGKRSGKRKSGGTPSPTKSALFPRRALVISIHDYLYANPIRDGSQMSETSNVKVFLDTLSYCLHAPLNQITHLSDAARKGPAAPMGPIAPIKSVIEKTLTSFCETSRAQDRILVIFIGHSAELNGEAYLVPVEGELDNASTLIPLKWVYEKLAKCKARQKVLVFDGNRFNPGQGLERPASGPLGQKFAAQLGSPPNGVEVWSACSAGQQSYETDEAPLGVFLDTLRRAVGTNGALEGTIQKPNDLIPLATLQAYVAQRMFAELRRRKLTQAPRLAGKPPATGADYDRAAALADPPLIPRHRPINLHKVKEVIDEVSVPPVRGGAEATAINFNALPAFPSEVLDKYDAPADPNSKLRQAVHAARVVLWGVSTATAPKDLQGEVDAFRLTFKVNLSVMKDRYTAPGPGAAEARFKDLVKDDALEMARIVLKLDDTLKELTAAEEARAKEPKRWQANYDFVKAALLAQMAYLEEYQALLGQMRKEFPPLDRNLDRGWRLASQTTLSGDRDGKRYAKQSRALLAKVSKSCRRTPWEVLAKRETLTALGLAWQPARVD